MSQGVSHYPISQLLASIIERSGLSRLAFVGSLGYRDLDRGLRRLSPWLQEGTGHQRILKEIAAVYPAHADEFQKTIAETTEVKVAEAEAAIIEMCKAEQETFRPYIHVEGEMAVPSGITMFAVTGGKWNLIKIPPHFLNLPLDDQLAAVPELMRDYLRKYNGLCPFFGKVTGFRLVRCLDYFRFDENGQFLQHVDKPFRRAQASCSLA